MKIIVLANIGLGLYKFRKELLSQLIELDNEVYVSFPEDEYVTKCEELGCKYIPSKVDRRGTNPMKDIKLIITYIKIIKKLKPDVVLTTSIKPNVYGGVACRLTKTPYIANVTGLGTSIENKGFVQKIALFLYKIGLRKAECVLFGNESNRKFMTNKKIFMGRTKVIPGSGVNLEYHQFEEYPENDEIVKFLFIGRIMKAKGIDELLKAAKNVKVIYPNVQLDLLGFCEVGYEHYLRLLEEYQQNGIVTYHGLKEEVHPFIKASHATILPSYHEGTSNALLESASAGRPILASRIPGCSETFDEGISGLGFEVKDAQSLLEAMIKFIEMPYEQKKEMGLKAREKMEREYDRKLVINAYLEEINRIRM